MQKVPLLVVDFGSQYTQLIARRVREIGVYCEIVPHSKAGEAFAAMRPQAVILSGGPASVGTDSPALPKEIFDSGVPILGICYGQMLLAQYHGCRIESGERREFGRADIRIGRTDCPLWADRYPRSRQYEVWMSHGDRIVETPDHVITYATSAASPHAVIGVPERSHYGLMFHPEVEHTPDGRRFLRRFVIDIAGCAADWSMASFREAAVESIRAQVGDAKAVCGLSGGVDSAVAAALIREAIGSQLTCIFVDHGLLRQGEAEQVRRLFGEHFDMDLRCVDAGGRFLAALAGVTDPEQKRKIIGGLFVDVFEEEARRIGGAEFLAQGTLYPDVIESAAADGSVTIKSHHNVGGLPERMNLQLLEPLRELFKDEVRELGRELGVPAEFVGRHPFPGPGLAVRCCGEVTAERLDVLRQADAVFLDEIRAAGLYDDIWQAFAVLLPVRSVGVMGDGRTYESVCALRAVTAVDGMTADFYPFGMDFLGRAAARIVNEVRGVNRVVYDVTSKPPGTIEWE